MLIQHFPRGRKSLGGTTVVADSVIGAVGIAECAADDHFSRPRGRALATRRCASAAGGVLGTPDDMRVIVVLAPRRHDPSPYYEDTVLAALHAAACDPTRRGLFVVFDERKGEGDADPA